MYLFCNQDLVEKTTKSKNKMQLKSNISTMTVSHKATVTIYHNSVCFSEESIMKIIALINLRLQYLVTSRSNEMMFIVYRESKCNPNMQFQMHDIGLH